MGTYIALFRGINVGGRSMLAMSDVRARLTAAGCEDVRTLLQSGNVVFRSAKKPKLDALFDVDVLLRTAAEWKAIVARNPFPGEAQRDPARLGVMCCRDAVNDITWSGPEIARADGRQMYVYYPNGMGTTKLGNVALEKLLGTRGTVRNWNTVEKIAALL